MLRALGGQDEDRLREAELEGQRLHPLGVPGLRVEDHRERVPGAWPGGEDVDPEKAGRHRSGRRRGRRQERLELGGEAPGPRLEGAGRPRSSAKASRGVMTLMGSARHVPGRSSSP